MFRRLPFRIVLVCSIISVLLYFFGSRLPNVSAIVPSHIDLTHSGTSHESHVQPAGDDPAVEVVIPPAAPVNTSASQTTPAEEAPSSSTTPSKLSNAPLKVAITETGGSHDEVVAALIHSFGSQPDVKLSTFFLLQRYGITDVVAGFSLASPIPKNNNPDRFLASENEVPDIIVAATCELDALKYEKKLKPLLENPRSFLFCVVHHADRWNKPELERALTPWVEANKVRFLALSSHTAQYLATHGLSKWNVSDLVPEPDVFVPVFPVPLPSDSQEDSEDPSDEQELTFALQGDYDSGRRNYASIFKHLGEFLNSTSDGSDEQAATNQNITLHLLGHGNRPAVPKELAGHIIFDENTNYKDFYSILSRTFTLLPAFATKEYLDRKASSSVPAALIGGTPLVATKEIVEAYSYLSEDVVWLQNGKESEFEVVGRVLKMTAADRRKKSAQCVALRNDLIAGNTELVRAWISDALEGEALEGEDQEQI